MFARLLAFSNGDLQALYDRSDGFYRRQLVLTTKAVSYTHLDVYKRQASTRLLKKRDLV